MPRSTEYGSSHPVLSLLPSGKQIRLSIRRPLQNETVKFEHDGKKLCPATKAEAKDNR